jgi:DNA repair protein RadC
LTLKHWRPEEQPRERLLRAGAGTLSSAELLAILLRHGGRGQSAVTLACDVLAHFGGVRGVFTASRSRLCAHPGIGEVRWVELQAAAELMRRQLAEPLVRSEGFTSPEAVRDYLNAQLRDLPHEVFCCFYLDNRHRLICFEQLFRGTIDGASVHPREVVRQALEHNAAALILAHNHPSGVAEPSHADELITRRLRDALALVDVRLLDHLIVGDCHCVSLAERGLL